MCDLKRFALVLAGCYTTFLSLLNANTSNGHCNTFLFLGYFGSWAYFSDSFSRNSISLLPFLWIDKAS